MQMSRIEAHLEIILRLIDFDARLRHLHGLGELAHKLIEPLPQRQAGRFCRFAPRQLQHIANDRAYALRVAADDIGQTALLRSKEGTLREQLPGMAHGAHGIADLMSDACREAPEGCELALLYPLGHEGRILEENERRTRSQ